MVGKGSTCCCEGRIIFLVGGDVVIMVWEEYVSKRKEEKEWAWAEVSVELGYL